MTEEEKILLDTEQQEKIQQLKESAQLVGEELLSKEKK